MLPVLPYNPTYYTAKGYRILLYVLGPPLMLLFLAVPYLARHDSTGQPMNTTAWLLMSVVGVGMAAVMGFGMYDAAKGHLALTATGFRQAGVFKTKELSFKDVQGFRHNDKYTFVVPKTPGLAKIKFAYTTERFEELNAWLAAHFPNLDQVETETDLAAALAREELGRSTEERTDRLEQARRTALVLNIAGGVAAAWLFLHPQPYQWAVAAGLLVPLLAAGALWWHQGVLRLDEATNSAYPSVMIAVGAPSLCLIIRALFDTEFLNYNELWVLVAQVGVAMALLLALGTRSWLTERSTSLKTGLMLLILPAMYGYGASAMADTAFDETRGQVFRTRVLDKHSSHGKTTTYYLTVAPWGPVATAEDVQVTSEMYEAAQTGTQVRMRLRPGRLGVPWFTTEW